MPLSFTNYVLNRGLLLNSGLRDLLRFMATELRDPPAPLRAGVTDAQHCTQFYTGAGELDSGPRAFVEGLCLINVSLTWDGRLVLTAFPFQI